MKKQKEMKEQYSVFRIDESVTPQTINRVWKNSSKRYFETLEEAKKAMEKDEERFTKHCPVKVANGIYVTIEEGINAKFRWEIRKRYVTEWEII